MNMLGKWNGWYKNLRQMGSFRYGNTVTYKMAEQFLSGLEVEDWGCGAGGFKRIHQGGYIGIDGSNTPYANKILDLSSYQSQAEAIMMRHVLEHNYDWAEILNNALVSFQKRFCLVIFTPFQEVTKEIDHNKRHGVDAPTIAFNKQKLETKLSAFKWKMKTIKTKTAYGEEHIYFIQK